MLLYVLVQVVFVGVGGKSTGAPLPDAARSFLGAGGAALLGAGGLVSMLGFNAGTALSTPRYLQALADERLVPPIFARLHARFETPAAAIVTTAFATLVLTFVLGFGEPRQPRRARRPLPILRNGRRARSSRQNAWKKGARRRFARDQRRLRPRVQRGPIRSARCSAWRGYRRSTRDFG